MTERLFLFTQHVHIFYIYLHSTASENRQAKYKALPHYSSDHLVGPFVPQREVGEAAAGVAVVLGQAAANGGQPGGLQPQRDGCYGVPGHGAADA